MLLTSRRSNQSILKEISPEYLLEDWCYSWSSNTLATWCKELTFGKDLDAGNDWRWEEKGTTEDEMVGRHHQLDGHEFEQAPGVGDGLGSLVCYSPYGGKELDTTEWLNWTEYDSNINIWFVIQISLTENKSLIQFKSIHYLYELAIFVKIQCEQKQWNFTIIYVICTLKQDGRIPDKPTLYKFFSIIGYL